MFHSIPASSIYPRSVEYFVAPSSGTNSSSSLIASLDSPDKILEQVLTDEWRGRRNHALLSASFSLRSDMYDVADRGSFEQIASLQTGFDSVSALLFHPFENLLVVAEKRLISLWDYKDSERVGQFSNDNARGSKISAVEWVNEHQTSLLLVGSDDGLVRLWRNVHTPSVEMVSAWVAVRSMPRGTGVGLVLDWQQETGHLLAAGPTDSIRVWDVEREICVLDLPVDSESYVSSICSMSEGGVVYAGCGDGVVRMFDLRADNQSVEHEHRPGWEVQLRCIDGISF
jgi:WD40 repeat protein